jgi:hypothetical protein
MKLRFGIVFALLAVLVVGANVGGVGRAEAQLGTLHAGCAGARCGGGGLTPVLSTTTTQGGAVSVSGSTCALTGADIGNPTYIGTRMVIAVWGGGNAGGVGNPVVSASIGGVSATIDAQTNDTAGWNTDAVITHATVTTGTTGTVQIVYTSSVSACPRVSVYISDASQLVSTTPTTGTNEDGTGSATNLPLSASGTSPGVNVGVMGLWSGSTNAVTVSGYTVDYNNSSAGGGGIANFHLIPITTGTQNADPTITSTGGGIAAALASWH